MKRVSPPPTPATLPDAGACIRDLEDAVDRAEQLMQDKRMRKDIAPYLELRVTEEHLHLVCRDTGMIFPNRLLYSAPLGSLTARWKTRAGRKDPTLYAHVYDSRTKTTSGGPPPNAKDRRYITFSFVGLDLQAWFAASVPPEERQYTFTFSHGGDTAVGLAEWVHPHTKNVVPLAPIYWSPRERPEPYGTPQHLLQQLRAYDSAQAATSALHSALAYYPPFTKLDT